MSTECLEHEQVPEAPQRLSQTVAEACQAIAQSWPMKTFAYRNPLRGWEHLPFDAAVRQARHLLGGNGYIPNEDYRQLYRDGRITDEAIERALAALAAGLARQSVSVGGRQITAGEVLRLHLLHGFDPLDPALLSWQLSTGATRRFRHDIPTASRTAAEDDGSYVTQLWQSTLSALDLSDSAHEQTTGSTSNTSQNTDSNSTNSKDTDSNGEAPHIDLPAGCTLSDWLGLLAGVSLVDQINDQLIKWTSAFLDEGLADWQMPNRRQGFYQSWRTLATRDFSARFLGIKQFAKKLRSLPESAADAVAQSLSRLDIPEPRQAEYLARHLAQLPGWAGFIRWLGENPGYLPQQRHPIDPLQYLAVRLFYEVELVDAYCRRRWRIEGARSAVISHWESRADEYAQLVDSNPPPADARTQAICGDAWRLFQLAQFLALTPGDVAQLALSDARTLLDWLDAFPSDRHGPVWLDVLETSYRGRLIDQLANHHVEPAAAVERPRAQLVLCIDVRSESFRRHIEDQGPYETLGYAGFFGIPMAFQAFDSAEFAALCPVIVAPGFAVDEVPRSGEDQALKNYGAGSRWQQLGQHLFHDLKSNPVGSMMLIDTLGLFFSARLFGKTFLSAPYEAMKQRVRNWFTGEVNTLTPVDRSPEADDQPPALPHGFTLEEQATFVERGLRAIGLTENFGRFIVLCGHGSTSENNPYFAAYNCGACGGGHGDPNARVFAAMANQAQVRQTLNSHGLEIPDDTWFLPAKHNTATDRVTFYDLADVPASHTADLRQLTADLEEAGRLQALERSQRLPDAPRQVSPQAAAEHMDSRSVDWSNVRPEWGLSGNGAFILGRRALTKGLDLGGRVFLHSYDPDADADGAILEALMNAPVVVAQWISMEYYFSAVDPVVYGSGSKVTHNVVSGIGVMHGSHGDLQTGLPLQSVNDGPRHYHEPVRLLVIIEAPPSRISGVIEKHTPLQHLFQNQWIGLVAIDPGSREFHRFLPDATWEAYR